MEIFKEDIVPVYNASGKLVSEDECIKQKLKESLLPKLRPAFRKNGRLTPLSSTPLTDGSAVALLASGEAVKRHCLPVLARITGFTTVGTACNLGDGMILSIPKLLKQCGLSYEDIDMFELHEAFATMAIATIKALDLDPTKVNRNGGSLSIGHPLGSTGCRLVGQTARELRRRGLRRAIISLCAG
jgi:acetyl-CoA acyltransferase